VIAARLRQQRPRAAAAERAAPAGARAPGAAGDPDAARPKRGGIRISDEQLNAALADVAQRNGIPLAQLPEALAQQGIDYAATARALRKELTLQVLRQRDVIQKINVAPRELEQYPREAEGPAVGAERVQHLAHPDRRAAGGDAAQLEEASRRAADVYERAQKGEDFSRSRSPIPTARPRSRAARSAGARARRSRPCWPTWSRAQARRGQRAAAHALRLPHRALNEMRGADVQTVVQQVNARHILLKPTEIQDDATVEQRLRTMRERILKGEDFAAVAKVVSEDPGSASEGGDLGWTGPGTFVPEFEAGAREAQPRTRSASRSARSSAGTSCSCSAGASSTTPTSCGASAPSCSCARARPTRRPSSGCAGCATRPMSSQDLKMRRPRHCRASS
jgi:peptidyl-prolyl cis-trans isomerase SurA